MSQAQDVASPFSAVQESLGATFADYRGQRMACRFADGEYEMLRRGCGVIDGSAVSTLQMTGADRQRFLNGLVTCDTKSLAVGEGCHGFVTSLKGRILSHLVALATDDSLWLALPPRQEAMADHLGKYIIVDQVEIAPLPWIPLTWVGPRVAEVLGGLGVAVDGLTLYQHRAAEVSGRPVRVVRLADLDGVPQWQLWLAAEDAELLYREVLSGIRTEDVGAVGFEAYERLRIESGQPLFGVDYDDENFPQETGLEDAVSYTKGCYLGQEIVARIHYRGGVNKSLRHVRLTAAADGAAPTAAGQKILAEGRGAGTLTSLTATDSGYLGLAILHQRVEDGAEVEIEGQGAAQVAAIP